MALDIHTYENGKMGEHLYSTNDQLYAILSPCFERYKQRTGRFIDPYPDLPFSDGLELLIQAVVACMDDENSKNQTAISDFLTQLQNGILMNKPSFLSEVN